MKLLIVDDSMIMRNIIEKSLASLNLEVVGKASDGIEALELFKETKPDLVTMDITMPKMDGLTCVSEMLKLDDTIKIMIISALSDYDTAIEALQKGAKYFLAKPFSEEKILEEFNIFMEC